MANGKTALRDVPRSWASNVEIRSSDLAQAADGQTEFVINDNAGDMDFRIEADANTNLFNTDAGLFSGKGAVGIGSAAVNKAVLTVDNPAFTAVATVDIAKVRIDNSAAITVPTGTTALAASVHIGEPNLTATGTITAAVTVYIEAAPTEGGSNYALWVDAGVTRLDGNLDMSDAALDIVGKANTAAALEITDGTTALIALDSRNTIADVNGVTITSPVTTIATAAAAHQNPSLKLANKTITYTGTNTVTSQLGAMLNVGVLTLTDASAGTVSLASAVHINAVAAAGGSLTLTAARMISTSVSDCYLTNAGVWTDTSCWAYGKEALSSAEPAAVYGVLDQIQPKQWVYREDVHGDDRGRQRVGIAYDDLPEALRAPGTDRGVSPGVLSSFALAALKCLKDENRELRTRLERLEQKSLPKGGKA